MGKRAPRPSVPETGIAIYDILASDLFNTNEIAASKSALSMAADTVLSRLNAAGPSYEATLLGGPAWAAVSALRGTAAGLATPRTGLEIEQLKQKLAVETDAAIAGILVLIAVSRAWAAWTWPNRQSDLRYPWWGSGSDTPTVGDWMACTCCGLYTVTLINRGSPNDGKPRLRAYKGNEFLGDFLSPLAVTDLLRRGGVLDRMQRTGGPNDSRDGGLDSASPTRHKDK